MQDALDTAWKQAQDSLKQQGSGSADLQPPEARLNGAGQLVITVPLPSQAHPQQLQQGIRRWASQLASQGNYYVSSRSSTNVSSVHGPTLQADYELQPSDLSSSSIKLRLHVPPSQTQQQRTLVISKPQAFSPSELAAITALVQDSLLLQAGGDDDARSSCYGSSRPGAAAGADDPGFLEFPAAELSEGELLEQLERHIRGHVFGGLHSLLRGGLDELFQGGGWQGCPCVCVVWWCQAWGVP